MIDHQNHTTLQAKLEKYDKSGSVENKNWHNFEGGLSRGNSSAARRRVNSINLTWKYPLLKKANLEEDSLKWEDLLYSPGRSHIMFLHSICKQKHPFHSHIRTWVTKASTGWLPLSIKSPYLRATHVAVHIIRKQSIEAINSPSQKCRFFIIFDWLFSMFVENRWILHQILQIRHFCEFSYEIEGFKKSAQTCFLPCHII